jgi:deoxyribodipyrimidine photo-lyase
MFRVSTRITVLVKQVTIARSFATTTMPDSNLLIYVMRRDLRVSDNPILHRLAKEKHGFTHLLPLYVFSAQQIEVKGFLEDANVKSPYPDAMSPVGGFPRCGPHRAKFLAESVWDVKEGLESIGSGLCIRVGSLGEVVKKMLSEISKKKEIKVGALWMVGEEGVEENREERSVQDACRDNDVDFKLLEDEKYFIDE